MKNTLNFVERDIHHRGQKIVCVDCAGKGNLIGFSMHNVCCIGGCRVK